MAGTRKETTISTLRTQMTHDMLVRGLAAQTQKSYLRAVTGLAQFTDRRPDQLSDRDVQRYLVHVIEDRHLAWGTCNTIVHGLRFFYHVTLGRPTTTFHIPCARQPAKLPVILSPAEVVQLFAAAPTLRHRTLLQTTYSAGLRVSEVLHLKVTDIDSQRMCLRIEQGKRRKDQLSLSRLRCKCIQGLANRELWHKRWRPLFLLALEAWQA